MIDYDCVSLQLKESDGTFRTVVARGYIGYRLVGSWDEIVIERAELHEQHPFIDDCVRSLNARLSSAWPDSGSEARNLRSWLVLMIHFSDGAVMAIVAAEFDAS
jgi:hypothetical protein